MADVQLNLVVIRAADTERAARFYRVLGLDFVAHRHGSGPEHLACESGPAVFEIYPRRDDADSTAATRLGFRVARLNAVLDELRSAGVRVVSAAKASPWGRRAVVEDPDGHRVELTESEPGPAG